MLPVYYPLLQVLECHLYYGHGIIQSYNTNAQIALSKELKVKVWKKFKLEDVRGITSTIRKGKRWKDSFRDKLEDRPRRKDAP